MTKGEHPGFIIDVEKPEKPGFVAQIVVTPYRDDGSRKADGERRFARDVGRHRALKLAFELLEKCDVPSDLLERVDALRLAAKKQKPPTDQH